MSNTIKFEIVTPERTVMKDMITQVIVPTKDGEITVLPKHIPLVSILVPGVLELKNQAGETKIMSVSGGFVEVLHNKVVILADSAERAEEINEERAEEARRRAEEARKNPKFEDKYANVSAAIAKELARTKAARRWKIIR
jgi:F-type H+-transporting ATPase subunit epsilon